MDGFVVLHILTQNAPPLFRLRPFHSMETLEDALQEVENIPAFLPNCMQLKEVVLKAKDWLQEVEALQVNRRDLIV